MPADNSDDRKPKKRDNPFSLFKEYKPSSEGGLSDYVGLSQTYSESQEKKGDDQTGDGIDQKVEGTKRTGNLSDLIRGNFGVANKSEVIKKKFGSDYLSDVFAELSASREEAGNLIFKTREEQRKIKIKCKTYLNRAFDIIDDLIIGVEKCQDQLLLSKTLGSEVKVKVSKMDRLKAELIKYDNRYQEVDFYDDEGVEYERELEVLVAEIESTYEAAWTLLEQLQNERKRRKNMAENLSIVLAAIEVLKQLIPVAKQYGPDLLNTIKKIFSIKPEVDSDEDILNFMDKNKENALNLLQSKISDYNFELLKKRIVVIKKLEFRILDIKEGRLDGDILAADVPGSLRAINEEIQSELEQVNKMLKIMISE